MSKKIRSERGHLARIERAARTDRKCLSNSGVRFLLAGAIAAALFIATFEPATSSSSSAQPPRSAAAGAEARPSGRAQQVSAAAGAEARPSGRAQQVSPATTRNAGLIAATQEVLKETSEIRQLSILRSVQSSAQSRAEIERALIKSLDEDTTPASMHADEVTFKKLGLAPPDFQYRALMLRVLTEQVAGYYDPKTGQFHLADWIDLDGQKPIMAHELTHALQDQHFNLRRFEHWPKGDSDAELAAHALIEGDATLAMALYVANNPLRALAFLKSLGATGMASEELDKAPRALRESLLFPYQYGERWVSVLYKRGGWNEISNAFTTLPPSTEQILHPEKYFAHEAPVKVTLPDIAPLLNGSRASAASGQWAVGGGQSAAGSAGILPAMSAKRELLTAHRSLPTAGWGRLAYDVNGEWGFYLILDQFLKSPAESRRAAAGWGGDRQAVYEGPKGEILIASLSTWDTENDAREFFDAYVKRTELRYPNAEQLDVKSAIRNPQSKIPNTFPLPLTPSPQGEVRRSWKTNEGGVVIEVRGNRVLVLEGVPDRADAKALLKSLWQ